MYIGFAFRIASILIPILLVGIITTGFLSLHKFEQTLSQLLTSRFEFVIDQIREDIQTQMDLGLALNNLEISHVIESYQQDDREILSIEFFDQTGIVLYSSDPSSIGDLVSEEWFSIWRLYADSFSWATQDIDAGVVGVPVRNNLDQNVGALVLRYSHEYLNQSVMNQTARLLTVDAIVAMVTILIAFLCAVRMLSNTCRELEDMGKVMEEITSESVSDSPQLQHSIQYPGFKHFIDTVLSTYKDMGKTIRKARALDEGKET